MFNKKNFEYKAPIFLLKKIKFLTTNPYKYINTDKKIIYVHIPKTAGRTIATSIYKKQVGHFPLKRYYYFNKKIFENSFKFTFVRNPWSRIFSAYDSLYECRNENNQFGIFIRKNISCYKNFDDFLSSFIKNQNKIKKLFQWTHFIPQYRWITFNDNKL